MGVYVPSLTYTAAASLDEALASLGEHPGARLLAGGHDLVPDMKAGRAAPPMLVDLRKVPGLREVSVDHATGMVRIGALATLNQLAGDTQLRGHLRALDEAIGSVGDAQVRNCTTVGGTLASRHPAADLAAVALALEAQVHTIRPAGPRTISAEDLLSGPATVLDPVEIITGVEIALPPMSGSAYEKQRNHATRYPIAAVAVRVVRTDNNLVGQCRVAVTGVFERPIRLREVEAAVEGTKPSHAALATTALKTSDAGGGVTDLFVSGEYRVHLASVLAERALVRAAEDAGFRWE